MRGFARHGVVVVNGGDGGGGGRGWVGGDGGRVDAGGSVEGGNDRVAVGTVHLGHGRGLLADGGLRHLLLKLLLELQLLLLVLVLLVLPRADGHAWRRRHGRGTRCRGGV